MSERNYDFRKRHWQYHKPGRRNPERNVQPGEILITGDWKIGYAADAQTVTREAAADFRNYFETPKSVPSVAHLIFSLYNDTENN